MEPPKLNWGRIIVAIIFSILFWAMVIISSGCSQRQVTYMDPNGFSITYKNNLVASKENIEGVVLVTPNGWFIFVGPYRLDNDSFAGGYGPIWIGTKK